jgi:hypothetical protein
MYLKDKLIPQRVNCYIVRNFVLLRALLGTQKTPLRLLLRNFRNVFQGYSSCMA